MIVFECGKCGEEMEIRDRMAGRTVRCPACDAPVRVPDDEPGDEPPPRRRRDDDYDDRPPRRRRRDDPGLSGGEWVGYGLLFACIPAVNVLMSSILYYVWKADRPKRANQINLLGFVVFLFHVAAAVALNALLKR